MSDSDQGGYLDFPSEGIRIFWDESGLRIQVIDYHAGILQLSWETILDLAQRARKGGGV
jgi:hypothetical protein